MIGGPAPGRGRNGRPEEEERILNRKMTQMLQPSFQLYFVCLILFAAASAFFSLYLAAAEAVVVVLLGLYYRENSRRRRREIAKYIENVTGNMDVATKDTMVNSPLPMVIFRPESDDIIWTNDRFLHLAGEKEVPAAFWCTDTWSGPRAGRGASWPPPTGWT